MVLTVSSKVCESLLVVYYTVQIQGNEGSKVFFWFFFFSFYKEGELVLAIKIFSMIHNFPGVDPAALF